MIDYLNLVITDLDGTLLDKDTYDFSEALEAISFLKERKIPIILCSSKTRAEIEHYQKKLGITAYPFISENGGAIYLPRESFNFSLPSSCIDGPYYKVEIGVPYCKIKSFYRYIKRYLKVRMKSFSEMTISEIIRYSGLSFEEAIMAVKREYSEPIKFLDNKSKLHTFIKLTKLFKYNVTKGGRFYTLMGSNSKGKAIEILKNIYRTYYQCNNIITIGLGDSINDISMFNHVEIPILVAGTTKEPIFNLMNLYISDSPGPKGWNESIFRILLKEK